MKLVERMIKWDRNKSTPDVAFIAKGKIDDGSEYTMVVAFSIELACWTSFLAINGSQIAMGEHEEHAEAREAITEQLNASLRIRS